MHILTVPHGISEYVPVQKGRSLEAGQSYLCSNRFVGQMLLSKWRCIIDDEMYPLRTLLNVKPSGPLLPLHSGADYNGQDIWLERGGGYGDLLLLTPLIREIKKLWPKCRLYIACGSQYHDLFIGLDVIPELMPIPMSEISIVTKVISFEEIIEGDPKAEKMHMAQLFADRAGIPITDLKPHYQITPKEEAFAEKEYPHDDRRRVAVQFMASGLYRSYPKIKNLILSLSEKGHEVFLFGSPGKLQLSKPIPGVVNLMERNLDFRESASILATCDVCIAPDSALVHLASALDVPCVGLYGPFPSAYRLTSDKAVGMDGKAPCAPCFFHAEEETEFPANMPCSEKGRCVALESIDVEDIVNTAISLTLDRS